jgi:hypothetical protein
MFSLLKKTRWLMRMDEKMLFERIIELLKDDDWKEQIWGMTTFSESTGTNFCMN